LQRELQTAALLEEAAAAVADAAAADIPAGWALGPANIWTAIVLCVGLKKHCITNLLIVFIVAVESYKLIGGETREKCWNSPFSISKPQQNDVRLSLYTRMKYLVLFLRYVSLAQLCASPEPRLLLLASDAET
jgi:hypothetical protein